MVARILRMTFKAFLWMLDFIYRILLIDYTLFFYKLSSKAGFIKVLCVKLKFFLYSLTLKDCIETIFLFILLFFYSIEFVFCEIFLFFYRLAYKVIWCLWTGLVILPIFMFSYLLNLFLFRYPLYIFIKLMVCFLDVFIYFLDLLYEILLLIILKYEKSPNYLVIWFLGYKSFIKILTNLFLRTSLTPYTLRSLINGNYIKDKENRDIEIYLNRFFFNLDYHNDIVGGRISLLNRSNRFQFLYSTRIRYYLSDIYTAERARFQFLNKSIKPIYKNYFTTIHSNKNLIINNSYLKYIETIPQSLILGDYLKRRTFLNRQEYVWTYPWFATSLFRIRDELGDNTNRFLSFYGDVRPDYEDRGVKHFGNQHYYWSGVYDSVLRGGTYGRVYTSNKTKSRRSFFYGTWFNYLFYLDNKRSRTNYYFFHDVVDGLRFLFVYLLFLLPRFFHSLFVYFYKIFILPLNHWFYRLRIHLIKRLYTFMAAESFFHRIFDNNVFSIYISSIFFKRRLVLFFKRIFLRIYYNILFFIKMIRLLIIELPARILIDLNFYYVWFVMNFIPIICKVFYYQVKFILFVKIKNILNKFFFQK